MGRKYVINMYSIFRFFWFILVYFGLFWFKPKNHEKNLKPILSTLQREDSDPPQIFGWFWTPISGQILTILELSEETVTPII